MLRIVFTMQTRMITASDYQITAAVFSSAALRKSANVHDLLKKLLKISGTTNFPLSRVRVVGLSEGASSNLLVSNTSHR